MKHRFRWLFESQTLRYDCDNRKQEHYTLWSKAELKYWILHCLFKKFEWKHRQNVSPVKIEFWKIPFEIVANGKQKPLIDTPFDTYSSVDGKSVCCVVILKLQLNGGSHWTQTRMNELMYLVTTTARQSVRTKENEYNQLYWFLNVCLLRWARFVESKRFDGDRERE